jgi:hypothetical protein
MIPYHTVGVRTSFRIPLSIVVTIILLSMCASHGLAQNEAALLYLRISPYARANGMGQAFVALSDQESPYYNPAGLGLFALSHYGSFTFYPKEFNWLPAFASDVELKHWALNVGYNLRNTKYRLPLSVGVGYYRTKMESGEQVHTSQTGDLLGTFRAYDRAHHVVFSLGIRSVVEGALGITYKHVDSYLIAPFGDGEEKDAANKSTYAFDFGALVKVPVIDLL